MPTTWDVTMIVLRQCLLLWWKRHSSACLRAMVLPVLFSLSLTGCDASKTVDKPNRVIGTWRMTFATLENQGSGKRILPYGPNPNGLLVFTANMHYVEVLLDPRVPQFGSDIRGHGTADENAAAMAASIGMFGIYNVGKDGEFSGNRVLGATFPNWVGDVRTAADLTMKVQGDTMRETFVRPGGAKIVIGWQRVR